MCFTVETDGSYIESSMFQSAGILTLGFNQSTNSFENDVIHYLVSLMIVILVITI